MGSCLENCVYKAKAERQRINPETGHKETWCAKLAEWVELNDNPCQYFSLRRVRDDRDEL